MMTENVSQQSRTASSLILEMVDDFSRLEGNLEVIDVFFYRLIEDGLADGRRLEVDIIADHLELLQKELKRYKYLVEESLTILRNET